MSMDIRSYFSKSATSGAAKRKKRVNIISSDEDDVQRQSPIKRSKLSKKPAKHHELSDSDEDVIEIKQSNNASKSEHSKVDKLQQIVSPDEVFSQKPVQRRASVKLPKKSKDKEKSFYEDEFEATLESLDTTQIEQEALALGSAKQSKTDRKKIDKAKSLISSTKGNSNEGINDNKKHHIVSEENVRVQDNAKNQKSKLKGDNTTKDISEKQVNKRQKTDASSNEVSPKNVQHPHVSSKKLKFKELPKRGKTSQIEIEHKKPKKTSPTKPVVLDKYEERIEKKKQDVALYRQYLQRGGARNPGSKQIPEGAEYCLAGLSFVITGILESLEREEADELIKKYGGRVLHQVSKKTDFVIVGQEAGPAKLAKADSFGVKQISETELLDMISTRPAGSVGNVIQSHTKSKESVKKISPELKHSDLSLQKSIVDTNRKGHNVHLLSSDSTKVKEELPQKEVVIGSPKYTESINNSANKEFVEEGQALVDKYRPKTMKQILGQQGDKSNAKKLSVWLNNWHKNQSGQVKPARPSPWAKNDDGGFFKATLLSGPPGIGKTTTAHVVCKEQGFDFLEFNASDTRNKKLLKERVSDLLSNTTMKGYFTDQTKPTRKHVLIMDEVDGMAGNEDRGGLQELISLIKSSDIPIICICNDRNNPKMRTLSNYTFDLKFATPRLEQIRGAMKSVCFKENIQLSTEDLDRLIESTNKDIRQVINHLALLIGTTSHQADNKRNNKDLKLGPWDVVRKVFSFQEHQNMSIHDKSDLFFHDYNIGPLFVQENYLSVIPQVPKNEILEKVALTAESLAFGDVVEKAIRTNGSWSLLPVQAMYSSVIPGTLMSGRISAQINFPSWLGRNSKRNKFDRLMQEITTHARLTTGASKEAINLDYLKCLRDAIITPLTETGNEDIDKAVHIMNSYHLMREDLDSIVEISLWPEQRNPLQILSSKVKAAFTRAFNKNSTAAPYAVNTVGKKRTAQASRDEGFIDDEEEEEINSDEDEDKDNIETDKMIKVKTSTTSLKAESKTKTNEKPKRGRKKVK